MMYLRQLLVSLLVSSLEWPPPRLETCWHWVTIVVAFWSRWEHCHCLGPLTIALSSPLIPLISRMISSSWSDLTICWAHPLSKLTLLSTLYIWAYPSMAVPPKMAIYDGETANHRGLQGYTIYGQTHLSTLGIAAMGVLFGWPFIQRYANTPW